jgi:hypothetical protein
MISADRISNYSVAEKTVGFFDDNSICQGSSVFALVRASDIQENADLMTIRSQTVNGLIKGKIQYQDGFAYLCAVE